MAEYTVVNLLTILVGIGLITNGYLIVRRGREDVTLLLLSLIVGLGLIVVALIPDSFQTVATILGLEWKGRAILVLSNLTLFVIVIYLFDRVGRLNNRISRLNEELSLVKTEYEDSTTPAGIDSGTGHHEE